MNCLSIAGLSFGITSLALGIFSLIVGGNNKSLRYWSYFNFFVAIWGFGFFMIGRQSTPEGAELWIRNMTIPGIFISTIFYHFSTLFVEIKTPRFLFFAYAQAIINSILFYTRILHWKIYRPLDLFYYFHATDWTYFSVTIFWLLILFASFFYFAWAL